MPNISLYHIGAVDHRLYIKMDKKPNDLNGPLVISLTRTPGSPAGPWRPSAPGSPGSPWNHTQHEEATSVNASCASANIRFTEVIFSFSNRNYDNFLMLKCSSLNAVDGMFFSAALSVFKWPSVLLLEDYLIEKLLISSVTQMNVNTRKAKNSDWSNSKFALKRYK